MPDAIARTAPARPGVELADVLAQHGPAFLATRGVALRHRRVMQQIVACRTAALGGHRQWCAGCGFEKFLYHSCRNRHCPKCQTQAKEAWREARQRDLLPVPYFHQVFTLPHELNMWVLTSEANQRALLGLLFTAVSATLMEFGRRELQGQVGFTLVLHTWDQQLKPHIHLHCLIAAGALAHDRMRWRTGGRQFLFPVRALSKMFRGKFLVGLQKLLDGGKLDPPSVPSADDACARRLLRSLSRKAWVVYSKAPFASPAKLLDYLSRYTHRVAIANHRLLSLEHGQVTFSYRDRRDSDRRKNATIAADDFISRFLTHVMPTRFMRIRHYGFLANRHRAARLTQIRQLLGASLPPPIPIVQTAEEWLRTVLGVDTEQCPCCGDRLRRTRLSPQPRENQLLRRGGLLSKQKAARGPPEGPPP